MNGPADDDDYGYGPHFVAGLGFSGQQPQQVLQNNHNQGQNPTPNHHPAVDDLVNFYMKKCVEYHHQQESKRQQRVNDEQQPPQFIKPIKEEEDWVGQLSSRGKAAAERSSEESSSWNEGGSYKEHAARSEPYQEKTIKVEEYDNQMDFGAEVIQNKRKEQSSVKVEDASVKHVSVVPAMPQDVDLVANASETEQKIESARARAQAVLARFQQQQEAVLSTTTCCSPAVYAAQRAVCFQRELARKERFWNKNFAYALARERQRLALESQQLEQAQALQATYHVMLKERQVAILEQRKSAAAAFREKATRTAGIGTGKQQARVQRNQTKTTRVLPTVAVYVSGFPKDEAIDEQFVRGLFSSYGKIRKIHFYRDKDSGELKGDGLIIYETDQDEETLVKTVCGQMSGAELPCGSQLRVEPSRSNSNGKKLAVDRSETAATDEGKDDPIHSVNGASSHQVPQDDGPDEELDDFFSSL